MKINLEQELLKANIKSASYQELLQLKELDRLGAIEYTDWKDLGFSGIKENLDIKKRIEKRKHQASKFDSKRVFHISQIKQVAVNYGLRFLPTSYYNGSLDKELPYKINNFKAAYEIKHYDPYILAPRSSFKLQKRPKDPLLFHKINDDYYYFIHKWGDDLSLWNYISNIPFRNIKSFNLIFGSLLTVLFILMLFLDEIEIHFFGLFWVLMLINVVHYFEVIIFNEKNWNSEFK